MALVLLVVLGGLPAQAAILRVPADHPSIQAAFDASTSGDTVHVAPGVYHELLTTPWHTLTVLSDYAWTGDSLDIERTIVDGSWSGTVLSVYARVHAQFRLEGFTLRRGMGTANMRAGGVYLEDYANATFRHVVFKEHRAPSTACRVMNGDHIGGQLGRLVLEDVRIELDSLGETGQESGQISVLGWRTIVARRLRFVQTPNPTALLAFNADSLFLADLVFDRRDYPSHPIHSALSGVGNRHLEADSITVTYGTYLQEALTLLGEEGGSFQVRRLRMEHLHLWQAEHILNSGKGLVMLSGGQVLVEDWLHRDCSANVGSTIGYVWGYEGVVRNLVAEDLVSGSPPSPDAECGSGCTGACLTVNGVNLESVVIRNVTLNAFDSFPAEWSTLSPSVIYAYSSPTQTADTLFFRDVEVSHVVVNDPDDYSLRETGCEASLGRAFKYYMGDIQRPLTVVMDSCRFVDNRQPNTQPERMPLNPNPGGTRMVGSTVHLDGSPTEDSRLVLRNTTLMHNDDGGLYTWNFHEVDVDNVVLVDNSRMGIYLSAIDSVLVNNLYVTGTNSYLAQLTYPYDYDYPSWQCVAMINGHVGTNLKNVTYENNDTEFVFWCPREDFNLVTYYQDLVLSGNTYDFLVNPEYNMNLFPPPQFNHCFLPLAQPGVGNLVGQDAGFDPVLGAPFLAANSPCIDAGNPDPAFSDAEDPALPGFPLWPAQGSLRNDMGFTGGPHAVAMDTSWVSVPHWEPTTPKAFSLGAAYPNPFNPVTRIPFTLARPERVKLSVHNLLGQEVAVLVNGLRMAGRQEVVWDAKSHASGRYLVTLEVDGRRETRAITLIR